MATSYTVNTDGTVVDNVTGATVFTGTVTQAIQWANDNIEAGRSIHLASGAYPITAKLRMHNSLKGNGFANTRLYAANALVGSMLEYTNPNGFPLTVADMEMDGMGGVFPGGAYGGLTLIGVSDSVFEDLHIHDFPQSHGIGLEASSHNSFAGCWVWRIGKNGQYGCGVRGMEGGASVTPVSSGFNQFVWCEIYECTGAGVSWEPGNDNECIRCHIYGNTSWTGGKAKGASVHDIVGWPTSGNNKFTECYIEQDGDGIVTTTEGAVLVDGCDIRPGSAGTGGVGMYIYGSAGSKVENNHVRPGDGKAGIYFYNSSGGTIENNHVEDVYGKKSCRGVWVTGDAAISLTGFTINGNWLYDLSYGVLVPGSVHGSIVSGNVCYDCTTCLYVANVGDSTVSGNRCLVGYAPMVMTIALSSARIILGAAVTISGMLKTKTGIAPPAGQVVTFVADNGDVIPSASTNASGAFSTVYTPTKPGVVYVSADYGGSP